MGIGVDGVSRGRKNVHLSEGIFDEYGCMFVCGAKFLQAEDDQGIIVLHLDQCGDALHV